MIFFNKSIKHVFQNYLLFRYYICIPLQFNCLQHSQFKFFVQALFLIQTTLNLILYKCYNYTQSLCHYFIWLRLYDIKPKTPEKNVSYCMSTVLLTCADSTPRNPTVPPYHIPDSESLQARQPPASPVTANYNRRSRHKPRNTAALSSIDISCPNQ